MASDDDKKDKDSKPNNPWEPNSSNSGNDGPPPIDQLIKNLFGGSKKKSAGQHAQKAWGSGSGGGQAQGSYFSPWFAVIIIGLILIIWAASGIYIVKPAQESVVTRFGAYVGTYGAGPHWIARGIESSYVLPVDRVSSTTSNGLMLTSEENIVSVDFAVKYRIAKPKDFLFNVQSPLTSLNQIIDSAVRQVVGQSTLNEILTVGRTKIRDEVEARIKQLVKRYGLGLYIVDVDMQYAGAPSQVKDAFEDVIKAREDQVTFTNQGKTYANKIVPIAKGQAARVIQQAKADQQQSILKAKGQVASFEALLPQYKYAPKVTKERMYLDSIQNVLAGSHVYVVDQKGQGPLFYMPLAPGAKPVSMPSASSVSNQAAQSAPQMIAKPQSSSTNPSRRAYVRWQEAQKNEI